MLNALFVIIRLIVFFPAFIMTAALYIVIILIGLAITIITTPFLVVLAALTNDRATLDKYGFQPLKTLIANAHQSYAVLEDFLLGRQTAVANKGASRLVGFIMVIVGLLAIPGGIILNIIFASTFNSGPYYAYLISAILLYSISPILVLFGLVIVFRR
jgi:hypothetical protein